MKLKNLEIAGFKSFRDKTRFEFSQGISAIVGPNGCGKSNVVDAIRWVMGEQRVSALRGKKMDDVIFNGSNESSPVGMAEVSLTFEANSHPFPGKHADAKEVRISRKIFREGDTEYAINGIPCRLLDVREFFLDAGVGARTYSIVEQERVSKLIEAKPQERRQFIEEAAGITKYKTRKESATRKMEATRQNLTRLNDIISEVKTRLNATKRQARKAEQYKELKKSAKESQLALSLQAFHELTQQINDNKTSFDILNTQSIEAQTLQKTIESSIEFFKTELTEKEKELTALQEQYYKIKNECNIGEQKIKFEKETIARFQSNKEQNLASISALKEKKEQAAEEIQTLENQISKALEKITLGRQSIVVQQARVDLLKDEERTLYTKLEEEKGKHFDIITENAKLKNLLSSLTKGIEDITRKARKERSEIEENTEKLNLLQNSLSSLKASLESSLEHRDILREQAEVITDRIVDSKETIELLTGKIDDINREIGIKSSRLDSLKEFQEEREWCNEGTRNILQASGGLQGQLGNIRGIVADHIEVPKEYEVAVEAALGEKLQYVIVASHEDGIKAIDYLKSQASGRSSFVPLKVRNGYKSSIPSDYPSDIVELANHVTSTSDEYQKIVEYLLGDVLLIPNLSLGIDLWHRNGFIGTFVTPDGDIINPHGVMTGGREGNGGRSLLKNKRELSELDREIKHLSTTLESEKNLKSENKLLVEEMELEFDDITAQIHELDLSINSQQKDIERVQSELKWVNQRLNVLSFNKETMDTEKAEIEKRTRNLHAQILSCEESRENVNRTILSLQERWHDLKSSKELEEKKLVEEKILLTSVEEKHSSDRSTLNRLKASLSDIGRQILTSMQETDKCDVKAQEAEKQIKIEEDYISELYTRLEEIGNNLEKKRNIQSEKELLLKEKEKEHQKAREACESLSKELTKLELQIREISLQAANLKGSVSEKYNADLDVLIQTFTVLSYSDVERLTKSLGETREKLNMFGEVNLLALKEYEDLKERHDFLMIQVNDLNVSLETLKKTIAKINQLTRKKFLETFEAVNQCFKEIFPKLFPGGKGILTLTEEPDILDKGVDMDIQIPGKKRQNLTLLSGGEKALSAIALIFSILTYRPSPFLILDEADAPLDDSNVSLFKQIVKDIALNSQIIFITHNKRTMEAADNLVGVTMAKSGISSIVSVNLN